MKNSIQISCSLMLYTLLFLHCTMSTAQTTTLSGVVYEKEQIKTTFETPKGKIKVYLPDDMAAGDTISGTVVTEPSGKNEKEQKKNLAELLKYTLTLPNGNRLQTVTTTDHSAQVAQQGYTIVPFTVPTNQAFTLELHHPNNATVASVSIPTLPAIPNIATAGQTPNYTVAKKVITNTEPIVLLTSVQNSSIPKLVLQNYHNTSITASYELTTTSYSSHKLIYNFPKELCGMYTVSTKNSEGTVKKIDVISIMDIRASIGKSSLMKGEKTELKVNVSGLEGCLYTPIELELTNKTPSVIQLAEGNQQVLPINQSNNPIGFITNQPFSTTQNVIGQTGGGFTINTTVHIPPSAYANTAQAYITASNDPAQFNSTVSALTTDITNYINNPNSNQTTVSYLQGIKDHLPTASNSNDLNRAKSHTVNMLNAICFLPGGNEFFNQLSKTNEAHPEIAKHTQTPQLVNPINDLAGEFNTETKQLQVNPEYQVALLQYLGATKMDNGNYQFTLSDGKKPVLYTQITILPSDTNPHRPRHVDGKPNEPTPTPLPVKNNERPTMNPKDNVGIKAENGQPQNAAGGVKVESETKQASKEIVDKKTESKNNPLGVISEIGKAIQAKEDSETKKEEPKKETSSGIEWPKERTDFTDSEGRRYRFYKDAECKLLYATPSTNCKEQIDHNAINKETGKKEPKPTGKYNKWQFQDCKRCLKGTGFCTEMEQIEATQMIYDDKDCQRLIEVKTYKGFSCQ